MPSQSKQILSRDGEATDMKILLVGGGAECGSLKQALEQAGCAVSIASSIEDLAGQAATGQFEVAIIDAPSSGRLKEDNPAEICSPPRSIPAIWLVDGGFETRISVLNGGADDCLSKPFELDELIARMNALIRKSPLRAELFKIRNIELDRINRTIKISGRILRIPTQEYRVLEELVRNVDKVVSKDQLLKEVWNTKQMIPTNLVETQISRLRAKLADWDAGDLIETVRGRGYRIRRDPVLRS